MPENNMNETIDTMETVAKNNNIAGIVGGVLVIGGIVYGTVKFISKKKKATENVELTVVED